MDTLKPGPVFTLKCCVTVKPLPLIADAFADKKKLEVLTLIPSFEELEKLGLIHSSKPAHSVSLQAIPAGFKLAEEQLSFYIRQFKLIFDFKTGAYKGLGGFGTIGGLVPQGLVVGSFLGNHRVSFA